MNAPSDPDADVPYGEELRSPAVAIAWAEAADRKRPWRFEFRRAIANKVRWLPSGSRVLELGAGPGLLAEQVLASCETLAGYTLFDFSEPMLALARERLEGEARAAFHLGDFKSEDWADDIVAPFQAVVTMQAVHEVRHKRHVPRLYAQVRRVLAPGGLFLVCDHTPPNDSRRATALFMTVEEQLDALGSAGFEGARVARSTVGLVLYEAHEP